MKTMHRHRPHLKREVIECASSLVFGDTMLRHRNDDLDFKGYDSYIG